MGAKVWIWDELLYGKEPSQTFGTLSESTTQWSTHETLQNDQQSNAHVRLRSTGQWLDQWSAAYGPARKECSPPELVLGKVS